MSMSARSERVALDALEPRLVKQGYRLIREPGPNDLPEFLQRLRPDAVALGGPPNLLIEVLSNSGPSKANIEAQKVERLRRLIDDHADWRLEVVYARSSGATPNQAPVDQILRRLEEVRQNTPNETSGALLLAWSLLEAVVRRLEPEKAATGLSPGSMIELLLSLGYLVQSEASTLRASGQLRNAIAHGDLSVPGPAAVEVYRLLNVVEALVALLNRQEAPG